MRSAQRLLRPFVPAPARALLRREVHHARALRYAGTRRYCPCCGGRFRTFLPYGEVAATRREQAECPNCYAVERHRMLWLYLSERTPLLRDPLRLLHVGPEPCLAHRLRRLSNLEYISADLAPGAAMLRMDLTAIPFRDDTLDVVLCSHVLEHIPDDRRAMREIARVLRPGGWAILQVPLDLARATTFEDPSVVDPEERRRLFNQHDHVRIYGRDYQARLEEAGLTVEVIPYAAQLPPERRARCGLRLGEDIFRCSVPG